MKRIIAASVILCLSCQAWASSASTPTNQFYIGAGAGDMFYRLSGNNSLSAGAGWPSDYYASNKITNQPYGLIAAGYAWQRSENWLPTYSLGVRYSYASAAKISGTIDQYSLPAFKDYNFSYDVQFSNLMAILKADIYRYHQLMPYVLVGLGAGLYSASNYSEQALPGVTPRVSPAFTSYSGTNFSYQLGAGLDYTIQKNLSLNIEYDYINSGSIQTGKGVNYPTLTATNYDDSFLKNRITANTLLLGLTYYLG